MITEGEKKVQLEVAAAEAGLTVEEYQEQARKMQAKFFNPMEPHYQQAISLAM